MALKNRKIKIEILAEQTGADLFGDPTTMVDAVTHDSRSAADGTVFVAIKGATVDGHRFIDDVMRRGAAGIISETEPPANFEGAWLRVKNARESLAKTAAIVNGEPSGELALIGITGTNGKTTTTYLCFALASAAGEKAAMLTTVEYRIGDRSEPAVRTTPEASDTNRFLRDAVAEGCKVAVMEASSQAIDLHRCDWLQFRIAIFTNLTQDHLDYHLTMANYFDAKKKLFDGRLGTRPRSSVINIDDEWGAKLAEKLRTSGQRVVTTSIKAATDREKQADLVASNINVSLIDGTSFTLGTVHGERAIVSPLIGKPHVYNMLSATAAALELGYDLDVIAEGLAKCVGAPGRFERVSHDRNFAVIVDYAHTDDALENTLETAKELTAGRVITVFGCGGDRDRTKRQPMGRVAGRLSDRVIITSDNPRTEDPLKIISEVEIGVKAANADYTIIADRRQAIREAVAGAEPGDVVIIAGKGHETYQLIGNDKFHFDDREVAAEAIAGLE